jgi:hypothetical protein
MKENLPEPRKIRPQAVPDELIGEALKKCKGLQYLAAEHCGINPTHMSERIKLSPYLRAIRDEAIEMRLDIAEVKLADLTEQQNLGALIFFLKTRGKHRGYTESSQVNVEGSIVTQHETMMSQLEKAQSDLRAAISTSSTS